MSGVLVHAFKKPYKFDGAEHASVQLDLRALTGKDIADLHAQWTALGYFAMQPETDSDFCVLVAAHAAGLVPEFFDGLPAAEYLSIETQVKVFLQAANIAKSAAKASGNAAPFDYGFAMDLEALTGRDLSQIKREWVGNGGRAAFPATDLNYCALVAARAAGVKMEAVQALKAPVYIALMREVGDFLQS